MHRCPNAALAAKRKQQNNPNGSMCQYSTYLGLKRPTISLLWGESMVYIKYVYTCTWTLWSHDNDLPVSTSRQPVPSLKMASDIRKQRLGVTGKGLWAKNLSSAQSFQRALIQEYRLNHEKEPYQERLGILIVTKQGIYRMSFKYTSWYMMV